MKIVYIVTRANPVGGAQVHVRDFALALQMAGHEPVVVTSGSGPYIDQLRAAGVQTIVVNSLGMAISPLRDLRALTELRALLKRLRPDLVSTHSTKAGVLGRLAARSLGIPVIFTAHGWAFAAGIPAPLVTIYSLFERLVAPLASRIITVSEFDRELAIARKVAASDKLVTIHNGMPDIAPELRANPSRSPVRMAMIARFEPQKDHSTLLHALAGLRHEQWHLDLIGEGPLMPQASELSRRLGLGDRVQFWGERMDVAARLAEVQVALLITNWEGFPRSILEAMRAGLPVISSSVGGVGESVRDGETGFTVPRGDIEALRERLLLLLTDPDLRTRMGRRAREYYEHNFTLARMVQRTMAIYQETIIPNGSAAVRLA
ncbi:MAG: glycosyltransferase family 4 protein [Gemmatimonadales bacterium]